MGVNQETRGLIAKRDILVPYIAFGPGAFAVGIPIYSLVNENAARQQEENQCAGHGSPDTWPPERLQVEMATRRSGYQQRDISGGLRGICPETYSSDCRVDHEQRRVDQQ